VSRAAATAASTTVLEGSASTSWKTSAETPCCRKEARAWSTMPSFRRHGPVTINALRQPWSLSNLPRSLLDPGLLNNTLAVLNTSSCPAGAAATAAALAAEAVATVAPPNRWASEFIAEASAR